MLKTNTAIEWQGIMKEVLLPIQLIFGNTDNQMISLY
jgi:hypothetical protein